MSSVLYALLRKMLQSVPKTTLKLLWLPESRVGSHWYGVGKDDIWLVECFPL